MTDIREDQLEAAFVAESVRAAFDGADDHEGWRPRGVAIKSLSVDVCGSRIFIFATFTGDAGWMRVSFLPGLPSVAVMTGLRRAGELPPGDGETAITIDGGMTVVRGPNKPEKDHGA